MARHSLAALLTVLAAMLTAPVSAQDLLPILEQPTGRAAPGEGIFPLSAEASDRLADPFRSTASPDWKLIRLMAELSFLAYEDSIPAVQNRLRLYDLKLGEFVTVDHHHFITAWDEANETLVVAFRGTDIAQLADIWTDLDYGETETRVGSVHSGFYDASKMLLGSVTAAIARRQPQHVWITGHSLGGAIATLTLWHLDNDGKRVNGLVTFGQPRVGDRRFTQHLNRHLGQRMLRVINEEDIVASLPPRIPLVIPAYYSGGSVIQFLDGQLVRSEGVQVMGKRRDGELDDIFGLPPANGSETPDAPRGPSGKVPPDPDQLTRNEFEKLKQILDEAEDARPVAKQQYGAPVAGPLDWVSDLKRRAAQHPLHLYIQNVEAYATRER